MGREFGHTNETPGSGLLSAVWNRIRSGLQAFRVAVGLYEVFDDEYVEIGFNCPTCGDISVPVGAVTVFTDSLWGFCIYTDDCGLTLRSLSLPAAACQWLVGMGAAFHPHIRPNISDLDVSRFVLALAQTDTPQEELV